MKKTRLIFVLLFVIIMSLIVSGCEVDSEKTTVNYDGKLIVHFIDVGQGDSTLIQFPNGQVALIDGGSQQYGDKVVNYIKELGIYNIDYLVATHPHEDHIGGLPEVIRNFNIDKVYMPKKTANTRIFEELLLEIDKQDLKVVLTNAKDYIIDKEQLKFYSLAPNREDYSETNDFSIVTKIEYMDNSFIIAGDAEISSEMDMMDNGLNLKSDVLRIGHHGGRTSSNEEFLERVKPRYSIISVGSDNTYGHPHKEVLKRLNEIDTNILRTDKLGDIVFVSDGVHIECLEAKVIDKNSIDIQYIGNKNTKVYHGKKCSFLPKKENQVIFNSILDAENNGYRPHEKCIMQGGD